MSQPPSSDITRLLQRLSDGDDGAADQMLPLVYNDLRSLAGYLMRGAHNGHTLQPTALVHEAWLKIQRALDGGAVLADQRHFQAVASRAMRQVLVNHVRDRKRSKRGGDATRIALDDCLQRIEAETGDLIEWNDLLEQLSVAHPRPAKVVEMRVFGGMTIDEVAEALAVSAATVKTDWRFARAWLHRELED